jgi:hypothetical protein
LVCGLIHFAISYFLLHQQEEPKISVLVAFPWLLVVFQVGHFQARWQFLARFFWLVVQQPIRW